MRRSAVTAALVIGLAGCHSAPWRAGQLSADPDCAPDGCAKGTRRGADGREEIVIHAPRQTVAVNLPPGECAPESAGGQPTGAPQGLPGQPTGAPQGLPGQPTGAPQGLPGQPQMMLPQAGVPMGVGFPQGLGAVPFGATGLNTTGATVTTTQRTRLAFALTTIHIPLPWIKLVPLQDQPEMKVRFTGNMQATQAAFPGLPMIPGLPLGAPQGIPGVPVGVASGVPMGLMAGSVGVQPQGLVAGPVGVQPQGLVAGTVAVQPQGLGTATGAAPQGLGAACPPCPPCPPAANTPGLTPERLQEFARRVQELEDAAAAVKAGRAGSGPTAPPAGAKKDEPKKDEPKKDEPKKE
jgi:hypothetical protein